MASKLKFNMHAVRREARREAWYGDSMNPFRQVSRSRTAPVTDGTRDLEAGSDAVPLSNVQTEPQFPRRLEQQDRINEGEVTATDKETESKLPAIGRASDPGSPNTMTNSLDRIPTNNNAPTRRRHKGQFWKKSSPEEETLDGEETEKKRPWYKGKVLPHKEPYTLRNQLERTLFGSWINILLLAAPAGIACNYAHVDGVIIFIVNFIAIIPLAGLLSFATEEIALHVGESLGGLLNATFGNAVEMIVAIIALAKNEIVVVQTSLIGSILSNLLLVLGMSLFFGGIRRKEQFHNSAIAQTAASLLALAVGGVIIPTCFDQFTSEPTHRAPVDVLAALSRGTSVILLFVYISYLYFQLNTHAETFNAESQKVPKRPRKKALADGAISKGLASAGGIGAGAGRPHLENRPPEDELINANAHEETEDDPEEPNLHIAVAWATLACATAIIGLCAEFMVDGISSITKPGSGISVEFVGLILLPIVGNAAEHATAVTVAVKDKLDLGLGIVIGSSLQISLLVIPLMVIIGWILGKDDMNLSFDGFQVTVLFVAVILVNYLIWDGKSHWLEGMLLQCLYLIIAVCAYYYPEKDAISGVAIWSEQNATAT